MTDAAATRSLPRHTFVFRVVIAILALAVAGSLLGAGTADAKRKKQLKVVSITPFATDALAKLNKRPAAIGDLITDANKAPAKFRGIRVLPLSHPNGPNLEVIAKIRPDVVFSSDRWKKGHAPMRQLGIRVVGDTDPKNLNQTYRAMRKIGRVVKKQKRARAVIKSMRRQVKSATSGRRSGTRVMVILGVGRAPQTFLHNSWGGQMVRLAGGQLLTGGATNKGGFARISDEVVVAQNPDVIIAVPHGTADDIRAMADYIANNEAWKSVNAVKNGRVRISTDNRLLQAKTDVGRTIRIVRNWIRKP
ncbi:MAG: ABC transporter substrate-binding protein [Actinomycetota bacterium]|nr:ABC transporter substrate-binding protein [Actinomycetota bacterium]